MFSYNGIQLLDYTYVIHHDYIKVSGKLEIPKTELDKDRGRSFSYNIRSKLLSPGKNLVINELQTKIVYPERLLLVKKFRHFDIFFEARLYNFE